MVKIMENMNKWMIWGETPLFLETPIFGEDDSPFLIGGIVLVALGGQVTISQV